MFFPGWLPLIADSAYAVSYYDVGPGTTLRLVTNYLVVSGICVLVLTVILACERFEQRLVWMIFLLLLTGASATPSIAKDGHITGCR